MKRCSEEVTAADSNNKWNMGGSDGVCQIINSKIKRSIKTASNMIDMSQEPIYSLKSSKLFPYESICRTRILNLKLPSLDLDVVYLSKMTLLETFTPSTFGGKKRPHEPSCWNTRRSRGERLRHWKLTWSWSMSQSPVMTMRFSILVSDRPPFSVCNKRSSRFKLGSLQMAAVQHLN